VNAPVDLAARRALHAEPEPEPEPDRETLATTGGFIGELRDRIDRIERRLTALERRGRL
jgi:hypothetical protein